MRLKKHSLPIFLVLFNVSLASAQDVLSIEEIGRELCATLLPEPELELSELTPELVDTPGFPLMVEAIQRHCAALGVLSLDEVAKDDPTRSYVPEQEGAKKVSDRLSREARYYQETAMQIDPDAANDLLKRLLGNGPKPAE